MTANHLGEWIRDRRVARGMNQRLLADQAGLSRSYVCDIERGRGVHPSLETFDKLAAALGATREQLLTAGGVLDPPQIRGDEGERRLLAVYRDLSPNGRDLLERFARFSHAEEHRWVQPRLFEAEDGVHQQESAPPESLRLFPVDESPTEKQHS